MTCDMGYMTCDTYYVAHERWGGEPSATELLRFGSEGVLKIFPHRITQLFNQLMSDRGVFRIAPATQGLLKIWGKTSTLKLCPTSEPTNKFVC